MLRRILKIIAFPLAVLGVFALLYAVWIALDLPPEQTIIEIAQALSRSLRRSRSFWSCAYLEGLLLIGWYFPGTLVIIFAFVARRARCRCVSPSSRRSAASGLFAAYVTNFFAGKYGWYRLLLAFGLREPLENAQRRLTKYGLSAIFTTYWQANLASCISTAAGILQFPVAALRGAFVSRGGVLDQLLGDADFLSRPGRAVARGLPHDPVR